MTDKKTGTATRPPPKRKSRPRGKTPTAAFLLCSAAPRQDFDMKSEAIAAADKLAADGKVFTLYTRIR